MYLIKYLKKIKIFYFVFVTILSYLSSYYGFLTHPSNWGCKDCIDIWHMKKLKRMTTAGKILRYAVVELFYLIGHRGLNN